jgi:endonuclease-3
MQVDMQLSLDLGGSPDLQQVLVLLVQAYGAPPHGPRRDALGQLVKSLISSRTLDRVSAAAYERLRAAYPGWAELMEAPPATIERLIADVSFPEAKARHLPAALRMVAAERPDFDLDLLRDWPVLRALAWLERLPGVGREVAAAALNVSTLRMPVFVVDVHGLRVLSRYGVVPTTTNNRIAFEAVMAQAQGWSAEELEDLHDLLKQLGQTLCRPNDLRCRRCPLKVQCRTGAKLTQGLSRS